MACQSCAKAREAAKAAAQRAISGDLSGATQSAREVAGHVGDKLRHTIRNGRMMIIREAGKRD